VHRSETDMTKRVLIVDDEPIVIALLRDCFAFKVGFPQPVRGSSASGACFAASKPARNSKNSDRELLRPAFAKTASDARSDDPRSCDVPRLSRHVRRFSRLAKRAALAIREVSALRVYPRRIHAMTREQPKAIPNWCLQVKPDEPWTGRCVKEKIAADGKRHRCHKTEKHSDAVHACQCSLEWKQF